MSDPTSPTALVLALRGLVLFPGALRTVPVGRPASTAAVERHLAHDEPLLAVPQLDPDLEDAGSAALARVGVACRVVRAGRLADGSLRVLLEGLERWRRDGEPRADGAALFAPVSSCPPADDDPVEVAAMVAEVRRLQQDVLERQGLGPQDQPAVAADVDDPGRLADQLAQQLDLTDLDRIALLEEPSVLARLQRLVDHLVHAVAAQQVQADVAAKVQQAMDASQREYHLKEQLKVLQAELGEGGGLEGDVATFEAKIAEAGMPTEVEEQARRELARLQRIHVDSAEYTISRTWLETICDVPWSHATPDTARLASAEKVLDDDHHGLATVKERILEYLAVRQLQPASKGPILCFVGPPGVGKTSLGRSIARALGRRFGRIALGGVKDETEIRGHRRTYVGSMPGRIVRALVRAGSRNPVLVLDELDKVGNDFRGDPASALLEVLDPEQNTAFSDHYLDVPVDLSQVLFIATANVMDTVPPALLDRLEVIEIPGYSEEEKLDIARRFLLPRHATAHGLSGKNLQITTGAISRTIRDYTREAGLRELDRQLAKIHRKVARRVVDGLDQRVRITDRGLPRYLGPPRYFQELAERVDQPGVVIGLAWTATGGDILFVEAIRMSGKASLKLTGSLGDVMKESAEAAMSWLRANALGWAIPPERFEGAFHLHVPAGAIPKDGPSAGVTMVTALASVCLDRPVRSQLAMTGEITLRGKVLPVGGVKEKVLAARRAGVTTVLMPRHNRSDLVDIPAALRDELTFHFVDTVDEVLHIALDGRS